MSPLESKVDCEVSQIKSLIGYKIVGACTSGDRQSYGMILQNSVKRIVAWVDIDEEGNGPGHLNLESASLLEAS